jgi:hypothetical protein
MGAIGATLRSDGGGIALFFRVLGGRLRGFKVVAGVTGAGTTFLAATTGDDLEWEISSELPFVSFRSLTADLRDL